MKKAIILIGICLMTMTAAAIERTEEQKQGYREDAKQELIYAIQSENASSWRIASDRYSNAAGLSATAGDWDNAINYEIKKAEMDQKAGRSGGLALLGVAEYYSKKGPGNEKEIRQYCELGETAILKEIEERLRPDKPRQITDYSTAYSLYESIAQCYRLIKDNEKSCNYCLKANEYVKKADAGNPYKCDLYYGCPKTADAAGPATGSVEGESGSASSYLIYAAAGIVLLLLVAALFLMGRKKNKK